MCDCNIVTEKRNFCLIPKNISWHEYVCLLLTLLFKLKFSIKQCIALLRTLIPRYWYLVFIIPYWHDLKIVINHFCKTRS